MKRLLVFYFLIFYLFNAEAQKIVSGIITDENNASLPGVNIIVKGTTKGTSSDIDGKYSIYVETGDTLLITMIGMENKEVVTGEEDVLNITLMPQSAQLDEVVVIGYGTVRKSDLTGSVSSVKGSEITKITSLNPEQGLQGKVAGVQITSTSGAPGSLPSVRVRGVGTFNNSSPIYVVDGVILNDISFISSADIESIQVLKDASATAIYGSRGANGVIIVTTKQGSKQEKAVFSYSGEYNIQKIAKKIELLNGREFAIISNEIRTGTYNNVDVLPNTDWQDLIFKTAPIQNHQVSVSGATNTTQYYVSVGYFNQKGIIEKSGYERLTIKLNNTYNLFDFFRIGNNITVAPYTQQNAPNVTYSAYRAQPLLVPYYSDGSFAVVYNVGNPLADIAFSNDHKKGFRGVGNVFAEADILKTVKLRSSFGIDGLYSKTERFTPAYTIYNPDGTASQQQNVFSDIFKGNEDNLTWILENTISFNKVIGKHSFDAVAGYTLQNTSSEILEIPGENVLRDDENFWYINSNINTIGVIVNHVDPNQYYSMNSYLFRVNYSFIEKYILTATFRRDGSSKFRKENRFSNFPSFAAGWNISKEKFMSGIPFINNLKIRGSWGIIGNEKIDYYDRYARVESGIFIFGVNQDVNATASYAASGNPDLVWESTTQTDIGIEIGLFDNKITGEFDYYNKVTDDILVRLSTPGYLGNGQGNKIRFNAGKVLNTGFEANINFRGNVSNLNYRIGILGSTLHNEVLEVGGNSGVDSVLQDGILGNGISVTQSRVGLPIGAFYGYKTDGVFQNETELNAYPHDAQAGIGDLRFVDANDDGVINGNDRTYIGSPIPKFIFGFNSEFDFKGFDLSFDLQGQTGNKIFNGKEVVRPDPYNFEKHVMDRWRGEGTSNSEPRPSFGGYNYTPSDRFIQDGSFIRLRTVMLGYTLPSTVSDKIYIQNLRIYIKGSNIFTLTKFTGYTPEIGSSSVLSNGIDNGTYPVTAVYSAGINLTF